MPAYAGVREGNIMTALYDIIVLAVIAVGAVLGFFKGILKTLLRFAQIIVVLALSGLAGMATVLFGLVDLEAISNLGSASGMDAIMQSGVIYFIVAFIVMLIISIVLTDYIYNKIIYGKLKFKQVMVDKLVGTLLGALVSTALVFFVFAVFVALEGTEFDIYAQVHQGAVATFFYDCNPFAGLIKDSTIVKIIITILNSLIPGYPIVK